MKGNSLFKITYLLFLFLIVTGSNLYFAGITLKYVITLFLFAWVLIKDRTIKMDRCFRLYVCFVFVFLISSMLTGHVGQFLNTFFRFYFPAYVGLRATHICMEDDNSFSKYILALLLLLGLFDVAVTYSQFTLNASWYEPIRNFFQFAVDEDFEEFVGSRTWLTTKSLAYGVFASAAMNGYYLCLFCLLSVYPYLATKKIWYLILPFIFLAGLFICQERSPLYLSVLLLGYLIIKSMPSLSPGKRLLILIGIVVVFAVGLENVINISEQYGMRFTERGLDGTGRTEIHEGFWEYIGSNPLFPNYYDLLEKGNRAPHNLFLNALVYGGPISFILIMSILVIQSKRALQIIKNTNNTNNYLTVAFTLGWIIFTANSLVHNRSIVTGELILWVLWAIMSHEDKTENKNYYLA